MLVEILYCAYTHSLQVIGVWGPLISSSSIMTCSSVLLCKTVVDLHARHEGGAEGVAKSCSAPT